MKKLFLFTLLAAGLQASAQTEKGNLMVGTDVAGLSGTLQGKDKTYHIGLDPKAGYFFMDKLAVGASLYLAVDFYSYYNYSDTYTGTFFSYGLLPFARYYFGSGKSMFFGEVDFGYSGYTRHYRNQNGGNDREHSYDFTFSAGPGFTHFITPNVGLEALLKVRRLSYSSNTIIQPALNLGFQIYLNRNKHSEKTENTEQ